MIASATYTFTPNAGGSVTVTNKATEPDVKAAVLAVLATRKTTSQGETAAIESAESSMNG